MDIYTIDEQIDALLTETGGELTPEAEALLSQRDEAEKWLINATKKLMNERAKLAGIRSERDRLIDLGASIETTIDGLERTIGRLLGEGNKADLGFAQLGWRKSEAVEILPGKEQELPDAYLVPKWVPDKTAIKKDLKQGAEIPFCALVTRQNLQIK